MVRLCCRSPCLGSFAHLMLAVSFLIFNVISAVLASTASRGREFIFAFPTRPFDDEFNLTLSITAFEAGQTNVNVTVVSMDWRRALTIPAQHAAITVELPAEAEAVGSGLQNTTVLVAASRDVSVFALSSSGEYAGGFLARSADSLGTDYFVVSYTPIVGEWSEFTVTATEDNTVIHINLEAPLVFDNAPYGKEELQLSLDRLQTAQFQCPQDLTGSRIRADRPVSVVSGSSASNVPAEFGSAGYLVEHLPPVGAWGTVHALAPLPGRRSGYRCKVVASCPVTLIRGFGDRVLVSTGESFEWDVPADSAAVITSSKPVLVAQFSKGKQADESLGTAPGVGGPAMFIAQSIDLSVARSSALLSTPALPESAYHHISITIRCNETSGLMLNDTPLVPDREYKYTDLEGICTVHKRLETADANPVIFVDHSAASRVPFAVSLVAHGSGLVGAYALSANLGAEVSPCEATGSDGCCFLEDAVSLSYDLEGSMGSSDFDSYIYNSVPELPLAQKATSDGVMLFQDQSTAKIPAENPSTSTADISQFPTLETTHGVPTVMAAATQDVETQTSMIEERNSVPDFLTTSRTTGASTQSTRQWAIPSATSSIPTTSQETATYSNPAESTDSSVSASSPASQSDSATEQGTVTGAVSAATTSTHQSTWLESTAVEHVTRDFTSAGLSTGAATPALLTSITTADAQTRLLTSPTLSTWLAATLASTPKQQTTEKVKTICTTCQAPFQILLYGGVAMAALLLLSMFICLVKISRSRHSARTAQAKRNSRWVAFPVSLSPDELNLNRLNLKPPPTSEPSPEPKPGPLVAHTDTDTDDDKTSLGENDAFSTETVKPGEK